MKKDEGKMKKDEGKMKKDGGKRKNALRSVGETMDAALDSAVTGFRTAENGAHFSLPFSF